MMMERLLLLYSLVGVLCVGISYGQSKYNRLHVIQPRQPLSTLYNDIHELSIHENKPLHIVFTHQWHGVFMYQ